MKLDIGCGNRGQIKKGYIGVDVNPHYYPHVVCDVNYGLPFKDETVEAVLMDNSLEHFWNPTFVLSECKRILKKDGIVEIILPNMQFFPLLFLSFFVDLLKFWNWWMGLPHKRERGIHYTLWTKYMAELWLESVGLKVLESEGWLWQKEFYVKGSNNEGYSK